MNILVSDNSGERSIVLLAKALEKAWQTYLTELERCRDDFSDDAVHDVRVAARRIITVIQILRSISPRCRLKKTIRTFKDQVDEFDELRDTQVILAEVSDSLQELPALDAFRRQQRQTEEKLKKRLRRKLKKFETKDLKKRIRKARKQLENRSSEDHAGPILKAVDDAYQRTRQRLDLVDAARAATIHKVRIAFKRFRYMVEIVHPLLDAYPPELLQQMHDYQSRMGEVQDAEVFLQSLTDYAENDSFQDLEPARRHYERRREEAIAAYLEDMNRIHDFWRAEPDQPFPWTHDQT